MNPRRPPTHGLVAPIAELADVLEPRAFAPPPHHDFAFADTVIAPDDLLPPPSGRAILHYPDAHYVTPLAFPLPPAAPDTSLSTQARASWARVRHGLRAAHEELAEVWGDTEDLVGTASARGVLGRLRFFGRRLLALWSCWQWDRTDVMRAAMIGIAVFLAAATFGASTLEASGMETQRANATNAKSDDLRTPHTLDQHTGRARPVRVRAPAPAPAKAGTLDVRSQGPR